MFKPGQIVYAVHISRDRVYMGAVRVKSATEKTTILDGSYSVTGFKTHIRFNDSRVFLIENADEAIVFANRRREKKIEILQHKIKEYEKAIVDSA